jgi:hypothetical protein
MRKIISLSGRPMLKLKDLCMNKKIIFGAYNFAILLLLNAFTVSAQKETFDIVTYTAPRGWQTEHKNNVISFTNTNNKNWCQIGIYRSTASKGSIESDFDSEWNELVVKQYKAVDLKANEVTTIDNWKIKAGLGVFSFNNAEATAMLTTMTGFDVCVSILAITNSADYTTAIQNFLGSVDLQKPANAVTGSVSANPATLQNTKAVNTGNYAFSTTNFDDGWTSIVQEDWVEVKKETVKVLIHYPKEGTIFPADPEPLTVAAWNILVAPRYSNLKNFKTSYISTYDRPYLGMGSATENASENQVYVVLFRQGQSGWIEFICPDKASFIQNFKFDPEAIRWDSESDLLKPLAQMSGYNKFAVAPSDFKGSWTSDFTGVQQLYHAYTGNYAGMNINQSNEAFEFGAGNTYNWKLLVVNGMVGATKYANVQSSGKFTVPNNWQLRFTDIEGKPKLCHAYFSCIKGARLLHLLDAQYPGSGIYTVYGKK